MALLQNRRRIFATAVLAAATGCAAIGLDASPAAAHTARTAAATTAAPVTVHAYPGGDSIALRWDPAPGSSPASYQVYRGSAALATVKVPGASRFGTTTARYVDTAVTVGQSYTYQVRQTSTDGTVSALSAPVSVTQVSAPLPNVNVVVSPTGADLAPMLDGVRNLIRTWYPKFAVVLADYTPPDMTLTTAPHLGAAGAVLNRNQLTLDEDYAKANKDNVDFAGTILHEAAHVLQGGLGGWLPEGLAVWTTHNIYHDADTPAPSADGYYTAGYDATAYLIEWIAAQSSLNWQTAARDLNIAWYHNPDSAVADTVARAHTGRQIDQLWAQMVGGSVQTVRSDNGLCIDNDYMRTTDGNPLKLNGCWDTTAQRFSFLPVAPSSTTGRLMIQSMCVDVAGGNVTANARVVINTCGGQASQRWTFNASGSLQNAGSAAGQAMCVQPTGWQSNSGNALEVFWCNGGSGTQHWNRVPV